ncbi:hypothetical protein DN069_18000 [Streptacidiphilus pinicola]|uniref:Uncharacterized protein n=1 Tax=Streptacidiphilus pinicola TaxID=2219663 RepID=A0A2X0ILR1_9ACTN|nr:hypothetical protein [Streptacidiphilus pinicola]RAG84241.1 hypothetical protein DN069_18000 [Streptacidiphilus pinicola]
MIALALAAVAAPGTAFAVTATTMTVGESNVAKLRMPNEVAGTFGVAILVTAKDGSTTFEPKGTTLSWKRADVLSAKATANA